MNLHRFSNRRYSFTSFISLMLVFILTFFSAFNATNININADETSEKQTTAKVSWPDGPDIFAEAGVLIEASTGTVLYDKNCHQQMYPASITKIMTTLLGLENGNLTDMLEYYHYDVYSLEIGDANIARQEGELLSLKDTLYAVMLASANECANAVGEYVARRTKAYSEKISELKASGEEYDESDVAISIFADMMNKRAKELGALGTHFSNPNGLFSEDHYTTPYDMAMIMRGAINNDEFLKIESNTGYTIPATNMHPDTQAIGQRHKMFYPLNSNYYEGIIGGKTGYVDQSGSTLVTAVKRNGMTLIAVVMKSNGTNVYNDTKLLLDYGFNNFSLSNVSENETKFSSTNTNTTLSKIFGNSSSSICLSDEGNVVLPNGVTLSDCTSKLVFNTEEDSTEDDDKYEIVSASDNSSETSATSTTESSENSSTSDSSSKDNKTSESSEKTDASETTSKTTNESNEDVSSNSSSKKSSKTDSANVLAKVEYYYGDTCVGGTDLILNNSENSYTFGPAKDKTDSSSSHKKSYININIFWCLGIFLIIAAIVAISYYTRFVPNFISSRNRNKRRRNARRRRSGGSGYSTVKRGRRR